MNTAAATLLAAVGFGSRVQVVAILVTVIMLLVVIDLVRRRRLVERYALLWMLVALTLLVLATWDELLGWGSELVGIEVPSNALFLAAFAIGALLLLNFSVAISKLSEQTKMLAQEVARLDAQIRQLADDGENGTGTDGPAADGTTAGGAN